MPNTLMEPDMKSIESQNRRILKDLKECKALTFLSALPRHGTGRLAARIYDIKKMGYKVSDRWIRVNGARVKEYVAAVKQR